MKKGQIIDDNFSSHLMLSIIQECEINSLRFEISTHFLQPLKVANFRPLKAVGHSFFFEGWKQKIKGPSTIPSFQEKEKEIHGENVSE